MIDLLEHWLVASTRWVDVHVAALHAATMTVLPFIAFGATLLGVFAVLVWASVRGRSPWWDDPLWPFDAGWGGSDGEAGSGDWWD